MFTREDLNNYLEHETGVFQNPRVKIAFETIDRAHFVPEAYADEVYEDYAIHYGNGMRLMKPTAAAYLLELGNIGAGQKVLIVGTMTGWLPALAASAVGKDGDVYVVEANQANIDAAEAHLAPYQFEHLQIFHGENTVGLSDLGPYDTVIVTRSLPDVPDVLVEQVRNGGTAVVPTDDGLVRVTKDDRGIVTTTTHEGFTFEPLAPLDENDQ